MYKYFPVLAATGEALVRHKISMHDFMYTCLVMKNE